MSEEILQQTHPEKKLGRPPKLSAKLVEKVYFLAQKGLTDKEISQVIDINECTLNAWKTSPVFSKSLKECKDVVDNKVQNALLTRALGYEYEEHQEGWSEKIGDWEKDITKTIIPDVTACIFWLKNRRKELWRDVQDHDHKGAVELQISVSSLMKLASENRNGNSPRIPEPALS